MTPDRLRWWQNLPKDQRAIRIKIAIQKADIKLIKEYLTPDAYYDKVFLKRSRHIIKDLQSRLVMIPYRNQWNQSWCRCGKSLKTGIDNFCSKCGSKIRW